MTPEPGPSRHWQQNLRLVALLLVVWFVVSFGLGILWVEPLNAVRIGGFPLGFWFSQQGSIYVFIVLILIYAVRMDRLDEEHRRERRERGEREGPEEPRP